MEPAKSTDFFINLISNTQIVYNKSRSDFKNTIAKDNAWDEIGKQCNITGNFNIS